MKRLLLATFCAVGSFAHGAEKPNALFIAIDEQNDWIACLGGHSQVKTPHIDGLAARGTLWDRSTRVPLIFAGAGVNAGAKCARPAELLDIFPTLLELAEIPARADLEGHSLTPQLKDARAPREWPAITTHNHNNHGIRTERWRYIRYADGSEELYDMQADPNEWKNLAAEAQLADTKRELARWLPKVNQQPAPGSKSRILLYDAATGAVNWEGTVVGANDPIPD